MKNTPTSTTLGAHPTTEADVLAFPNPDVEVNRVIAEHQDAQTAWAYGGVDLAREVRAIRSWARDLVDQFFASHCAPGFLFRFEREGSRVLGHYVPGRNDVGLQWEISINPRHLTTRSERQTAAVLLHELLHWFEESVRPPRRSAHGYHSAWFRKFAQEWGIPCTRYGAELGIVAPSPFSAWADEHGLRDDVSSAISPGALPPDEPHSKRVPWVCACPPGERVTAQVPRASELRAHCDRCGAAFHRKGEAR